MVVIIAISQLKEPHGFLDWIPSDHHLLQHSLWLLYQTGYSTILGLTAIGQLLLVGSSLELETLEIIFARQEKW